LIWLAAVTGLVLLGTIAAWLRWPAATIARRDLTAVALATYPGIADFPTFSPTGSQVAFMWNGPAEDNFDIYVKVVGAEPPPGLYFLALDVPRPGAEPLRQTTSMYLTPWQFSFFQLPAEAAELEKWPDGASDKPSDKGAGQSLSSLLPEPPTAVLVCTPTRGESQDALRRGKVKLDRHGYSTAGNPARQRHFGESFDSLVVLVPARPGPVTITVPPDRVRVYPAA
jgi:hypothetical protein